MKRKKKVVRRKKRTRKAKVTTTRKVWLAIWWILKKSGLVIAWVGCWILVFLEKNLIDKYGRLDTGRIGQFVGLALMVVAAWYSANQLIWGLPVDTGSLLAIAGPGGVLMTLYRLKAFTGEAGSDNKDRAKGIMGKIVKKLKALPKGG